MKKKISTSVIVLFLFFNGYSQEMIFDWAKTYESTGGQSEIYNQHFAADSNHLFIAGRVLSLDNDFDPDTSTYMLQAPFFRNYHISMFNLSGTHVWSKIIGSTNSTTASPTQIRDIELGNDGYLYLTGAYLDTLYFETASGWQYVTSKGDLDIFFGKMDTLGNWLWVKSYGGIYDDQSASIAVSENNDFYICGYYADSVSFLPNSTPEFAAFYETYILKLNALGEEQWVYSTHNPSNYPLFAISGMVLDDEDGIYAGGNFFDYMGDSVNFQSFGNEYLLPNTTNDDGFILKIDTAGNFNWAKSYTTSSNDYIDKIAFSHATNKLVISGRAGNMNLDFDPTTTADSLNFSTPYANFLLSISPTGQYNWMKQLYTQYGGPTDLISYIAPDKKGNVHCLSTFDSPIDADPGMDTVMYYKSPGGASFSSYSLKLDSLGNYVWSYQYKTISNGDISYGIGIDPFDNVYVGLFDGVVTGPDTLPLGNLSLIHSATSRHFLKLRACGAESVAQLNDSTLVGVFQNVTYQWLDCDNGYAIIAGATEQTFTPSVSGNYALESTSYACTADTSACYSININVSTTGITNKSSIDQISVFPNPATDKINVKLPETKQVVAYRIYNVLGETMYQQNFKNTLQFQVELPDPTGIYFIEFSYDNNRIIKKVVKE